MIHVQFITHHNAQWGYLEGAKQALLGGCRWIQLRMKEASDDEVMAVAMPLRHLCHQYGAQLIIDDRVHLVRPIGADGVHLGRTDMPPAKARQQLGDGFIIGGTANTMADIRYLYRSRVDYIGCGPYHHTNTKQHLAPILGLKGYCRLLKQMHLEGIHTPLIAIGGITRQDILPLLQAGVSGIALSGYILRAAQPSEEMKLILQTQTL